MNLVRLYVPTANELAYRRFLIGDEETMSYLIRSLIVFESSLT